MTDNNDMDDYAGAESNVRAFPNTECHFDVSNEKLSRVAEDDKKY